MQKHVSDWHCVPFLQISHSETCFRLALCKLIISNPYAKCKVLMHKLCKETKSKAKLLHLFVCFFSNECRATSNAKWGKKTYCCLPSISFKFDMTCFIVSFHFIGQAPIRDKKDVKLSSYVYVYVFFPMVSSLYQKTR